MADGVKRQQSSSFAFLVHSEHEDADYVLQVRPDTARGSLRHLVRSLPCQVVIPPSIENEQALADVFRGNRHVSGTSRQKLPSGFALIDSTNLENNSVCVRANCGSGYDIRLAVLFSSRRARDPQGGSMKIRILGVPLDLGQERRGVDMGPSAVRAAGLNAAIKNLGHQVEDAGNVHVKLPEEQHFGDKRAKYLKEIEETCQEVAHRVYQTLEAGFFPVSLGGDHSIAIGTIAGVSKFYRDRDQAVGCIWIDAHADMNTPETSPSGNVHGMPFAATLGYGPEGLTRIFGHAPKLQAKKCVLIGVRDLDSRERRMVKESGIHVFTMREVDEQGMRAVV